MTTTTTVVLELSEQGGRDYNQDRLIVLHDTDSGDFLALVSDGVGGTARGEVAAECLTTVAAQVWQQRSEFTSLQQLLQALFEQGNAAIAAANEAGTNTAATLVALAARGTDLMSVHAGDSRIYQCRDDQVVKVTQDHSLAYAKFKLGEITEEQIATHPGQSQLLNCMTGHSDVHAEYSQWQVANGDYFVLCSDGFWELFPKTEMAPLAGNENRQFVIANRLEQMLQQHPRHDNTSAVFIHCGSGFAQGQTDTNNTSNKTHAAVVKPPSDNTASGNKSWAVLIIVAAAIAITALLFWPQKLDHNGSPPVVEPQQQEPIEEANTDTPEPLEQPTQPQQPEQPQEQQSEQPQPAEPAEPEQPIDENAPPVASSDSSSEQEGGSGDNPTEQLGRRLNEAPRDTIPSDGSRPDIDVLEDHLRDGGVITEQSELEQTNESKDELAHIVSVQLMVHNTPVFGAVVRYLKTATGMQLVSGRLAYLDDMPSQPSNSFDACFERYQQQQQAGGETVTIMRDSKPTLYIDAGDSIYFWSIRVVQSQQPSLVDLHLRDDNCDALRMLPLQVSGQ